MLIAHVKYVGPGIGGDYGPYRQSERNVLYKQYAENLINSGHVYRCFCSTEVILFKLQHIFVSIYVHMHVYICRYIMHRHRSPKWDLNPATTTPPFREARDTTQARG